MSPDEAVKPFSTGEALRFGWNTTKANLTPLVILGVIAAFFALLNQSLTQPPAHADAMRGLLILVINIVQVGITMMWIRLALQLHDGRKLSWGRANELLAEFFPFLLVSILYGLVVALGMALLIVPGVIWGLKYAFSTFLVVDRKLDPVEAFRESNRLTMGVKGPLFGFAMAMFGVNLLGAIALGIGLIVTVPTTFIAAAHVLRTLQARAGHGIQRAAPPARPVTDVPAEAR
jgi:uncharacterized membrane protein